MGPVVVVYSLAPAVTTNVVNAATAGTTIQTLVTSTGVVLDNQRRLLITATGNESGNTFTITGLNQAGFTVSEAILGPNASTVATNVDFKTVLSVKSSAVTAGILQASRVSITGSRQGFMRVRHAR